MNIRSQVPVLGEYKRQKVRLLRNSRGIPSLIDVHRVRSHLEWLWSIGFSDEAISHAAGLPRQTVWQIRTGVDERKHVQITRATRLLAVTHIPIPAQDQASVPAVGVRRRIYALNAIGYSARDIATELGVPQSAVWRYTQKHRVYGQTWSRIADLYERWSGTSGTSSQARTIARKRGYAPPLAWHGIDIDHPDHEPEQATDEGEPSSVDDVLLERILRGQHDGPIGKMERRAVLDYAVENSWSGAQVATILNLKKTTGDRALVRRRAKLRKEAA
jgi:DNA-directed RNA polymerase specialized sigma24 family protein